MLRRLLGELFPASTTVTIGRCEEWVSLSSSTARSSGATSGVRRLVSTPVVGRATVSEASVGMSADAAGKSACATPGGDLTGAAPLLRVPRHQGRRGHPIWFSRDLIAEFLGLPENGAAREIVRAHAAQTEFLDVDDPGILADIDDAAAYGRLTGAAL